MNNNNKNISVLFILINFLILFSYIVSIRVHFNSLMIYKDSSEKM
jgi:hypothetical protein